MYQTHAHAHTQKGHIYYLARGKSMKLENQKLGTMFGRKSRLNQKGVETREKNITVFIGKKMHISGPAQFKMYCSRVSWIILTKVGFRPSTLTFFSLLRFGPSFFVHVHGVTCTELLQSFLMVPQLLQHGLCEGSDWQVRWYGQVISISFGPGTLGAYFHRVTSRMS